MIKKEIEYESIDGDVLKETFYFNLSALEAIRLEAEYPDGLEAHLRSLANTKGPELLDIFVRLIRMSVGARHLDGKRFVKSDEIADAFMESQACDSFLVEMFSDPTGASAIQFFTGLLSAKLQPQMQATLPSEIVE